MWGLSIREQHLRALSGLPQWKHLELNRQLGPGLRLGEFTKDAENRALREGSAFVYERHLAAALARDDILRPLGINGTELVKRITEMEEQEEASEEVVVAAIGQMLDPVTAIGTREYLEEMSRRVVKRCRAENLPCAAVFVDVDNFKKFNDAYGHDVGDRVLRGVAGIVSRFLQLRGAATGRYGGEEIVATIPNMTEDEADFLGERIRTEVTGLGVNGHPVTVSVGVACDVVLSSHDALWRMADKALLHAKALGKNRVVRFSRCPP